MKKSASAFSIMLACMLWYVPVMAEYTIVTEPVDSYQREFTEPEGYDTEETFAAETAGSALPYASDNSSFQTEDDIAFSDGNIGFYTGMLSSLYRFINGNQPVSAFSISADELTSQQKAFLLYYYQYNVSDSRIKSEGEFNCAYIRDMQDILHELFYNAVDEDLQYFEQNYVDSRTAELYYMPGTGDFGDAGSYYFNNTRIVDSSQDYVTISGDVMEYDNAESAYLFSDTFHATFKVQTYNGRPCYSFDYLSVGSTSDTYGSSGYDGSAINYEGVDIETKSYLSGLALDYFERHHNYRPQYADVESQQNGKFLIHLYDVIGGEEGGHTATSAWYLVDHTGYGTDNLMGGEVNLLD